MLHWCNQLCSLYHIGYALFEEVEVQCVLLRRNVARRSLKLAYRLGIDPYLFEARRSRASWKWWKRFQWKIKKLGSPKWLKLGVKTWHMQLTTPAYDISISVQISSEDQEEKQWAYELCWSYCSYRQQLSWQRHVTGSWWIPSIRHEFWPIKSWLTVIVLYRIHVYLKQLALVFWRKVKISLKKMWNCFAIFQKNLFSSI